MFAFGYKHKEGRSHLNCFVAVFIGDAYTDTAEIAPEKFAYASGCKKLEIMRFIAI